MNISPSAFWTSYFDIIHCQTIRCLAQVIRRHARRVVVAPRRPTATSISSSDDPLSNRPCHLTIQRQIGFTASQDPSLFQPCRLATCRPSALPLEQPNGLQPCHLNSSRLATQTTQRHSRSAGTLPPQSTLGIQAAFCRVLGVLGQKKKFRRRPPNDFGPKSAQNLHF